MEVIKMNTSHFSKNGKKHKNRRYYFYSFFLLYFLSFYFLSCKNFLTGEKFIDEMETTIEYLNSPKFTVYITLDDPSSGILISAATKESCRVSDTISLEFKVADDYQFLRWKAVNKNDISISYDEYVSFEDSSSTKTNMQIIKSCESILNNELLIRPVCVPTMGFNAESCAPKNTSVTTPACNDSTITLCFTNPISSSMDNCLNKIQILCDEKDYSEHYGKPEHSATNPNVIYIPSNPDNRITFDSTSDLKEIKVVIPEDFCYSTENGDVKIGRNLTYSFIVNYATSLKTSIVFSIKEINDNGEIIPTSENLGTLRIEGQTGTYFTKEYNIGETKQILLEVNNDYEFIDWKKTEGTDSCLGFDFVKDEFNDYLYKDEEGNPLYFDKETKSAGVLLKIYNSAPNIDVFALVRRIPSCEIKIGSTKGKISPNNTQIYQQNTKIPLTFSADTEYLFTNWQVLVNGVVDPNQEFIIFENKDDEETVATLAKTPVENVFLTIEPACEIRPVVLSKAPVFTDAGVCRDARIKIMFDHIMDISSIYFTEKEVQEAGGTYDKDSDIIKINNEDKIYRYTKDGVIYYKNIKIIDSETKKSILEHFDAPFFESGDVLVIPAKKSNPVNPSTQVIVEISPAVSYKVLINMIFRYLHL